ncbi:glycosyltransferase [Streptomyces sp. NPDC054849]
MSTVSVVIPCYKYGHFLADCVRSALDEQEGVDVRVLIIDDASPDDSADVARALAAADPRIEVRVHERNQGHIATYNEGLLEWADGDYVALLSADDRLVPGALVRAAALLDAHPEAGFAYGRPLRFRHGGPLPAARTRSTGSVVYPGRWWLDRRFREGTGCITSPEVVVRTSLQRKVGGYDPQLPHAGDIEMWMRLAAHADVGYVRGADQAFYRVHGDNMSTTDFGGQLDDLRQRLVAFDSVLDKCGDLLPGSERLALAARTRLARYALRRAYRAYDRGRTAVVPVDELVEFAAACLPEGYTSLAEYRALRRRRRIGARVMPYLQPLVLSAVADRGREWLWWRSWKRRGI